MRAEEVAFVLQELGCMKIEIVGNKVRCCCPLHHEKNPSFAVMFGDRGVGFRCLGCHETGSLRNLIWRMIKRDKKPYTKALYVTYEAGFNQSEARQSVKRLEYKPMGSKPSVRDDAPALDVKPVTGVQIKLDGSVSKSAPAKQFKESDYTKYKKKNPQYMLDRGFNEETLEAFGIREATWSWRIIFPIRNWDGVIKGMSRRLFWEKDWCFSCKADLNSKYKCPGCGRFYAKYLHSKGFDRNEIVYGEWLYEEGAIPVLVEGFTDVMNLWQHGIRPPLAMPLAVMGTWPGEWQIRRVLERSKGVPIVLLKDFDDASKYEDGIAPGDRMVAETTKMIEKVEPGRRVYDICPPEMGMDPGDFDATLVATLRTVIEHVKNKLPEGRSFVLDSKDPVC